MVLNTCQIIKNNYTCEIIDSIIGRNINKTYTLFYILNLSIYYGDVPYIEDITRPCRGTKFVILSYMYNYNIRLGLRLLHTMRRYVVRKISNCALSLKAIALKFSQYIVK